MEYLGRKMYSEIEVSSWMFTALGLVFHRIALTFIRRNASIPEAFHALYQHISTIPAVLKQTTSRLEQRLRTACLEMRSCPCQGGLAGYVQPDL